MASNPRPLGSYLWGGAKEFGGIVYNEGRNAAADIGNTGQAVLYGWNAQAAHNATMNATLRLSEEAAIAEDNKRIEPQPEVATTGLEKE
jgi:hypothetical protein